MIDYVESSQYLLVSALILTIAFTVFTCFQLFVRRDVLRKNEGINIVLSVLVCAVLVLFCYWIIWALQDEASSIWFGIPFFTGSVAIAILLIWAFSHFRGTEERVFSILETLTGVIEAGDPNLEGHSLHVRNLTMLLYDNLPFKDKLKINPHNLAYAALFLDVGKLGIPRSIINKTGKLEKEEWEIVRRHPELAVKILQHIPSFDTVSTWIKYHHERVDGTGYYKLKKADIPLASRLIAIADTYSALTMERSYKATLSYEDAISELKQAAGTQLDAELVHIFCSIPPKKIEASMNEVKQKMQRYADGDFR